MAKIITTNFRAIQDALNKLIINEVKAALRLVPEKCIREEGSALCRIIVGSNDDYSPRSVAVDEVWLDDNDGMLHIYGRDLTHEDCFDQNWADNVEPDEWTEEDGLYDITDFEFLIEQLKELMADGEYDLTNGADLHELDRRVYDKLFIPFACDRRKYGMSIHELCDKIAAFTGDKKTEAMRKARIFATHISLRDVAEITSIKYGHRTNENGSRMEDRNWLEFRYLFTDGSSDVFSIIE